jgi:hypothetical protein
MANRLLLSRRSCNEIAWKRGRTSGFPPRISVMVKRIAHVGFACFFCLTLTASIAVCQSEHSSPSAGSLPDAPSAQASTQAHSIQRVTFETHAPALMVSPGSLGAAAFGETISPRKASAPLFFKHLYSTSDSSNSRYRASDSDTLMGRATDAASRIFVTRDETGRRRINTTYFLRVATSIAAHNAARTYRARSGTAPLGDFGSTVGNDAGMNLLHEFGPVFRKAAVSHLPVFVSRIEERFVH